MTEHIRTTPTRKIIGYSTLAILIVSVIGLCAVDYRAGIAVVIGIGISFMVVKLWQYIGEKLTNPNRKILGIVLLVSFRSRNLYFRRVWHGHFSPEMARKSVALALTATIPMRKSHAGLAETEARRHENAS
jgi:hypothetical protein